MEALEGLVTLQCALNVRHRATGVSLLVEDHPQQVQRVLVENPTGSSHNVKDKFTSGKENTTQNTVQKRSHSHTEGHCSRM